MSVYRVRCVSGFVSMLILVLAGCSSTPVTNGTASTGGGNCSGADCADGGQTGGATTGGMTAGQTGGQTGANNSATEGQPDAGDSMQVIDCAKVEEEAKLVKKPVDIIWVVDSSGSMDNEAAIVQSNMNSFASSIEASGLDYHVVVVTKKGFLTVPDPLGSDAAHFLFVDEDVGSNEPLDALINRFADYSSFLRPGAITHFVVVTDDEARKEGGFLSSNRVAQTRDWFADEMSRLLRHEFILHAVASEVAGTGLFGIKEACKGAAAPGEVHYALAAETSGLTFSICAADWSALFTQLSTAVTESTGVSCNIPMPEPPKGLALNPEQVSIGYTAAGGTKPTDLMRVAGASACKDGGWYFDRPLLPRFIELCPATCEKINNENGAKLNVSVDCGSNACAGVGVQADVRETPVDIIWVIDSSGSMDNEAKIVQDNLNDFVKEIAASGIDYRVVVMSTEEFVFVPDPLGSDTAHLRFIEEDVGSDEPLDDLLERFADYSDFLRPTAITHIIAVTDDEARREGADAQATSAWFQSEMKTKLGHDFTLHAIVSEDVGGGDRCTGPNGAAARPGLTYIELAGATMGQFYSICSADWTPLFDGLVRAVLSSSPIECAFDLPPPPKGKTFDKDEVNVRFAANGSADITILGRTTGKDQCKAGGWYYDDAKAPKRILICDNTCTELRKEFDGAIEIQLGCETEVIPPMIQ